MLLARCRILGSRLGAVVPLVDLAAGGGTGRVRGAAGGQPGVEPGRN